MKNHGLSMFASRVLVACLALVCWPNMAMAQGTITVCQNGSCDYTTIQAAIDSVAPGGAAEILVSAGTYDEGPINFGGVDVVITGVDGKYLTTLTQSGTTRVMRVQSGNAVRLEGLTISGGSPNGGTSQGGGIKVVSGGSLEMYDCIVRDNQTQRDGGGVFVADGGTGLFERCIFKDNACTGTVARNGGGLCIESIDGNTIDRCIFDGNATSGNGGGLYQGRETQDSAIEVPYPQVRNCLFVRNSAEEIGGGAYVLPALLGCEGASVLGYVTNCTFKDNSASVEGAIYGNESIDCSAGTYPSPSILVVNSVIWDNGPAYTGVRPTTWVRCVIDGLDVIEASGECDGCIVECVDVYPRFVFGGNTANGFEEFRVWPGSPVIDSGRDSILGVPIEFGSLDLGDRDRVVDNPVAPNDSAQPVDCGANEWSLDYIDEIGLALWRGGATPTSLIDPSNWYDGKLPEQPRTWSFDGFANVDLGGETLDWWQVAIGSGRLRFNPTATGKIKLDIGLVVGFLGGEAAQLQLASGIEIESDLLYFLRGHTQLNGGTLTIVGGAPIFVGQDLSTAGSSGDPIATIHGPGTIRPLVESEFAFDPILTNGGRLRIDDLLMIDKGDYSQAATGILKYQYRSSDDPDLTRQLVIEGMASLDGTVVFDIQPDSWNPEVGSQFTILEAGEGFHAGNDTFALVVTQWPGDSRFFSLSAVENASGSGSSIIATVVSLDSLLASEEALDVAGHELTDMLLVDVDADGADDLVLSVDRGDTQNGAVVVLRNQGVTSSWDGFTSYASATLFEVGLNPRGLDAGHLYAGGRDGNARLDIIVANQGDGTVSILRNLSNPGSISLVEGQLLDLVPSTVGQENPRPIDVCSKNFDEDSEGFDDLLISCLDSTVWTFQNLNGLAGFTGGDPLGNDRKDDRPQPLTRLVPGSDGGGGKRDTGAPGATGSSSEGNGVDSGQAGVLASGVGITIDWTTTPLVADSSPFDLTRADLDGDGVMDLVTANKQGDSLSILMGLGSGAYGDSITIELDPGYEEARSIASGDIDGDGDVDIVVSCVGPELDPGQGVAGVVRVIRNMLVESGAFGLVFDPEESFRGQDPYLVRISDLDGDGVDDIIVLTSASNGSMNIGSAFGFSSAFLESGSCTGDLDGNNAVDGADLSLMLGSWGTCSGKCDADLDEDGTVGGADLALLLGAWGACGAEAQ